jgi:hypothetical protein
MFAYVTLLLASATSFPGGSTDAFAKSLAESSTKNVIIVSATRGDVAKFSFDTSDLDGFSAQVRAKTRFRKVGGVANYFNEQKFVQATFKDLLDNPNPGPVVSEKVPDTLVSAGKVNLDTTKGGAIEFYALTKSASWTKPVECDYLFQTLGVSAEVKNMPEREFLEALAQSAGGTLTLTDNGYRIAYDPAFLRQMITNTVTPLRKPDRLEEKDIKRTFFTAVVQDLGDSALINVFNHPGNVNVYDVTPNSDAASAAIAYIQQMAELEGGQNTQSEEVGQGRSTPRPRGAGQPAVQIMEGRIDTRVPAHIRISASGQISVSVPVITRGSRKSQYIEV